MRNYTPNELKEIYNRQPLEIKEMLTSAEIFGMLEKIYGKYNLDVGQSEKLGNDIAMVIMDIYAFEDLQKNMGRLYNLPLEITDKILAELESAVISSVRLVKKQLRDRSITDKGEIPIPTKNPAPRNNNGGAPIQKPPISINKINLPGANVPPSFQKQEKSNVAPILTNPPARPTIPATQPTQAPSSQGQSATPDLSRQGLDKLQPQQERNQNFVADKLNTTVKIPKQEVKIEAPSPEASATQRPPQAKPSYESKDPYREAI